MLIGYGCVSLVVTTLIEAVVLCRAFQLRLPRGLRLGALANLASALGCIPIGILLGGSEHELIPLAVYWRWSTLFLFIAAVLIETVVVRGLVKDRTLQIVAVAVLQANVVSYGLYLLFKLAL